MIGRVILQGQNNVVNSNLKSLLIEGKQEDVICTFSVKQIYYNQTDQNTLCMFIYPTNNKMCTYGLKFIVDGKEIVPELKEKEEAQSEFNEACEKGRTAILGKDIGQGICSFSIGNLAPGMECIIEQKYCLLASVTDFGYKLKIPLKAVHMNATNTGELPEIFKFTHEVRSQHCLSSVTANDCTTSPIDDGFKLTSNEYIKSNAIHITAKLKDQQEITALKAGNFTVISTCPLIHSKVQSNNEFAFLIDCSLSMCQGSRIKYALQSLVTLLNSLPFGCRFSIILFGSQVRTLVEMQELNKSSLERAILQIKEIEAGDNHTDTLSPLKTVFSQNPMKGFARQVFILTDGETADPDSCIAQCWKHSAYNRVFAIGFGDADPGFIEGVSEAAHGASEYVSVTNLEEISKNLLLNALSPAATGTQIFIEGSEDAIETSPHPLPPLYNNNGSTAIVKGGTGTSILVTANTDQEVIELATVASEHPELETAVSALFAFNSICELQRREKLLEEGVKDKIVKLSIETGVLSKYTAYVGSIEKHELGLIRSVPSGYMVCHGDNEMKNCCMSTPDDGLISRPYVISSPVQITIGGSVNPSTSQPSVKANIVKPVVYQNSSRSKNISKVQKDHGAVKKRVSKGFASLSIKAIISKQLANGSWPNQYVLDTTLIKMYGIAAAATIEALVMIYKKAGARVDLHIDAINKGLMFLKKLNPLVKWEYIISMRVKR